MTSPENEGSDFEPKVEFLSIEDAVRRQAMEQDRLAMAHVEYKRSIDSFIDGLSADDAWTLYRMMMNISQEGPLLARQFVGQLEMLLRRIHGICTACGNKDHSAEEHLLGDPDANTVELPSVNTPAPISDEARMAQYGVHLLESGEPQVACNTCNTVFISLQSRIEQGMECPSCVMTNKLYDEAPETGPVDGKTD